MAGSTSSLPPDLKELPVSKSQVVMHEMVLPNDTNSLGSVLGGHVMHLMDICAAMTAMRHCRKAVVTAAVDHLSFHHPVNVGEIMILKASVNYADHTSMEVGVRIDAENPLTGDQRHTSSAYLTFVALDEGGRPTPVPKVVPESESEQRRYRRAQKRRQQRLKQLQNQAT